VNVFNRPAFQALSVSGAFGLSPRGGYLSVFDNEKSELAILDRATGKSVLSVLAPPDLVTADLVRYSSDDLYVAIPDDGKSTTVFELKNPRPRYKKAPEMIEQTISGTGKIIAWSTAHDIQLSALGDDPDGPIQGAIEFVNAYVLQLSPDGKLLAAAGKGPGLSVFNVATRKKVYDVQSRSRIRKAIFSPDGRYLLISSDDQNLILCAAETGAEVWRTANAKSTLIVFSNDGNLLGTAGGGERGSAFELTVKETATQRPVLQISKEALPIGIAFSHDGASIDVLDNTSFTHYYMATKDLVEQTCRLLTRNLAGKDWTSLMGAGAYHRTCPDLP
jgi:WD40 repeat protein